MYPTPVKSVVNKSCKKLGGKVTLRNKIFLKSIGYAIQPDIQSLFTNQQR